MLDTRLSYARGVSETLREDLGRNQIDKDGLLDIATDITTRLKCEFEFASIDLPKEQFKALVAFKSSIRTYCLLINKNLIAGSESEKSTSPSEWFFIAHEVGHIVLHRDLFDVEVMRQSPELEDQADFFARLCFWPLERITLALATGKEFGEATGYKEVMDLNMAKEEFPPKISSERSYSRDDLCHQLAIFASQAYEDKGWNSQVNVRWSYLSMLRYANEFLYQYERYLPHSYCKFMSYLSPYAIGHNGSYR